MEVVVAGRGTERVALGATPEQIRAGLGAPPKIVEHLPLSYLYVYPDLGVEVDFVVPNGAAEVLFFFGDWGGHRAAAIATENGLTFGAHRDEIVAHWGPPAGSDVPHAYERRFHTGWLYYRQGIQFHLNQLERLVIVAIMRPAAPSLRARMPSASQAVGGAISFAGLRSRLAGPAHVRLCTLRGPARLRPRPAGFSPRSGVVSRQGPALRNFAGPLSALRCAAHSPSISAGWIFGGGLGGCRQLCAPSSFVRGRPAGPTLRGPPVWGVDKTPQLGILDTDQLQRREEPS